ncbi:MAG: DUF4339 domain-containing protein [Planctomycetes bacterium]|nr:DUF4339 domain-containing protein [Planctomycetota bacterium]
MKKDDKDGKISRKSNGSIWYVSSKGSKFGPFTIAEITHSLETDIFDSESLAWRAGMNDWYRIIDIAEFRDIVREISPDKLKTHESSYLKEKLICPNCFTRIPITAKKCPACELVLKKKRDGFSGKIKKEPWHFRISVLGGLIMLLSLIFPWIKLTDNISINDFGLTSFYMYMVLALLIVSFSVQNLLVSGKRNLVIWICSFAALMLVTMFSSDILERKQQIQGKYLTPQAINIADSVEESTDAETENILDVGIFLFAVGALVVLFSMTLPSFFSLIRKPAGSITLIILSILIFLSVMQLMNGNAYKFILGWQLRLKGYNIVEINRVYDVQDNGNIDKVANFEIFAKFQETVTEKTVGEADASKNNKISITEHYLYGVKSIKLGTFNDLSMLKLSRIHKDDFCLYPEFTKQSSDGW